MTISSIVQAFENQYIKTQYLKLISPMMKAKVITLLLGEIGKELANTDISRLETEILSLIEKRTTPTPSYTNQIKIGDMLQTEYENPKELYYAIRNEYGKNWLPRRAVYAIVDQSETYHLVLTSNPYSSVANMVYRLSKQNLFCKKIYKLEWICDPEDNTILLTMRNIRMFYISRLLHLGFKVSDYGLTFKYNQQFVLETTNQYPEHFIRLGGILSKAS